MKSTSTFYKYIKIYNLSVNKLIHLNQDWLLALKTTKLMKAIQEGKKKKL